MRSDAFRCVGKRSDTSGNFRIFLICSVVFGGFQAEDFGKLSAPVFHIFLDQFRAPGAKIRQISSNFSNLFSFLIPKSMKIQLFPNIFKRTGPETMLRT